MPFCMEMLLVMELVSLDLLIVILRLLAKQIIVTHWVVIFRALIQYKDVLPI